MKLTRCLALLLTAALLLGLLSACAGPKPEPTPEPEAAAETPEPIPEMTPEPTPEPEPEPAEEYSLPREPGTRQLTLYWTRAGADLATCDIWVWYPDAAGHGELFHPCAYGGKVVLNVPETVDEVGFIVRRGCSEPGGSSWGSATKDYDGDRWAVLTGEETVIYLKSGDQMQYVSEDGGATLKPIRIFTTAGIISPNQIRYQISPAARFDELSAAHVYADGEELSVLSLDVLGEEASSGVLTLAEPIDLSRICRVELEGYGEAPAVPTELFDSPEFAEEYTYEGDDLGAVIRGGKTVFKVWAPTASAVELRLFEAGDGGEAFACLPMTRGERGVWSAEADCGHGTYYTYAVTTSLGTQEAVDPYARSVGVNGNRGMVLDLALTDPAGFRDSEPYTGIDRYSEAVIWEVHVRDFSNALEGSQYPGKYLAFTETGLRNRFGVPAGLDYLKELGVTHVHLQPVYDYATVDESSDEPQFNWGYDPKNYNAPEGSYSTDPWHGEVRVNEFKQMVQSLHENGLGVVMDVVYNHTFDINSNLNKIVPYYYYRFVNGLPANGSGCGNELASERPMVRKYIVDSVSYWASEYKLDGFRFDLMALHDLETMQAVESAVHAVNPRALIYGEGWTGGDSPLPTKLRANQQNIRQITRSEGAIGSVAVFNDVIRDGLKGSVFEKDYAGYINGKAGPGTAAQVIFGLRGGANAKIADWSVSDAMVINYMSCHDNNTLWDKLAFSCPDADEETRFAMNRLGATIVLIGRGTPFFLAGEEMLRTKGGNENSYNASDAVNNLDWDSLDPDGPAYEMMQTYKALIAMRRANAFFTQAEVNAEILDGSVIAVNYWSAGQTVGYAFINPNETPVSEELPGGAWVLLSDGETIFPEGGAAVEGTVEVPARSVLIVRK
ncbi:MAG: type I pullulanase [Oscillospiraceae bacterium]|nr:type I pullulanase [Oscillospiraceae bacterium]